jgi:Uma2 family endonuclease
MPAVRALATYEDLLSVPPHHVGEILFGVLHASPRPALPHAVAASALGGELSAPFKRGKGGPGGWVILDEPELHVQADILVPDLAGWRRERMPVVPSDAFTTVAPDWVAEVLSPSTASIDRGDKLKIYLREGVHHVWLIDPIATTLEILALDGTSYRLIEVFSGIEPVRAVPFDAIAFDIAALWAR